MHPRLALRCLLHRSVWQPHFEWSIDFMPSLPITAHCYNHKRLSRQTRKGWTKIQILKRKVFLPLILNLIQSFTGIRQWRMENRLKILVAEFKGENYKFILQNFAEFTEMMLYCLLANLMTWNSVTSFF